METIEDILHEMQEREKMLVVLQRGSRGVKKAEYRDSAKRIRNLVGRIKEAVLHAKERSRRRAERSSIYHMLNNFPENWRNDQKSVEEYLSTWRRYADSLCEGGEYGDD